MEAPPRMLSEAEAAAVGKQSQNREVWRVVVGRRF